MSAMKSGGLRDALFGPVPVPVHRRGSGVFPRAHGGQAGEDAGEVNANVCAEAAAVPADGVEDGAFAAGFSVSGKQPVLLSEAGSGAPLIGHRTDGQ